MAMAGVFGWLIILLWYYYDRGSRSSRLLRLKPTIDPTITTTRQVSTQHHATDTRYSKYQPNGNIYEQRQGFILSIIQGNETDVRVQAVQETLASTVVGSRSWLHRWCLLCASLQQYNGWFSNTTKFILFNSISEVIYRSIWCNGPTIKALRGQMRIVEFVGPFRRGHFQK